MINFDKVPHLDYLWHHCLQVAKLNYSVESCGWKHVREVHI